MTQIPPTIVDCMSRFSFFRWGKSKSGTDDPSRDGDRFLADRVDRKKSASGKNADDPHLPEKKRARRRLVGSMTLVLAAVIVLPMIFESEPRPVSPDLLIDIPSKAKAVPESTDGLPSVSADGTETQEASPGSKAPSVTPPGALLPSTPVASEQAAVAPVRENTTSVAAKPAVAPGVMAGQHVMVEKPVRVEKTKPDKAKEEKPAKPETETDPIGKMIAEKTEKPVKTEKQIVQIAALTSPQKVSELQTRLSKAGIRSHTQKVKSANGEERIRVRAGPFSGKSEVDAVCTKLKKMGLSCTLVSN